MNWVCATLVAPTASTVYIPGGILGGTENVTTKSPDELVGTVRVKKVMLPVMSKTVTVTFAAG